MIEYIEGDIFESPAQVIVNTVNTVGVMGKGLALSFKQRYPQMFEKYKLACEKHQLTIGKLMLFYEADHWLLMFPTKENWRNPSKLEYIEKGLMKFVQTYAEKNITSIAFPRLGCGNGELNWVFGVIDIEHYRVFCGCGISVILIKLNCNHCACGQFKPLTCDLFDLFTPLIFANSIGFIDQIRIRTGKSDILEVGKILFDLSEYNGIIFSGVNVCPLGCLCESRYGGNKTTINCGHDRLLCLC